MAKRGMHGAGAQGRSHVRRERGRKERRINEEGEGWRRGKGGGRQGRGRRGRQRGLMERASVEIEGKDGGKCGSRNKKAGRRGDD